VEIARKIFEGAELTLRAERIGASVPVEEWKEELRVEELSLYTGSGRALIGAAKDLAEVWASVEAARREGKGGKAEERRLDLVRAGLEVRYPLLLAFGEDGDPSRLARIPAGTRREAAAVLMEAVRPWWEAFEAARATLKETPERAWSSVTLAVLAVVAMGDGAPSSEALEAHVTRVGKEDEEGRALERAVRFAVRVIGTAPVDKRRQHDGVLAPPLDDRQLGALLARRQFQDAEKGTAVEKAVAVARGLWRLLWLALDLVEAMPFEKAGRAFVELMPDVTEALRGDEEKVLGAVREKLAAAGKGVAERAVETLRGMRAGKSGEELRGGSPGYERRFRQEAQEELERDVAEAMESATPGDESGIVITKKGHIVSIK
jgi:hypothetical protein